VAAAPDSPACPDCDETLTFTFPETSGLGAWKQGGGYNTTPDTQHFVCFLCEKAWKRRLDGRLTADVVGDLAFFSCRRENCGARLSVTREDDAAIGTELLCPAGHAYVVRTSDEGGLTLEDRP
jgi:hypothetical protein